MTGGLRWGWLLWIGLGLGCAGSPLPTPEPASGREGTPLQLASRQRPLTVGFLMVDGVYNTELTAPFDVFHHTVFHAEFGMKVFTVAPTREPVVSFEGLRLLPDHTFADCPPLDILVVPSAEHNMDTDLADADLIGFVRSRGAGAALVLSLCDGAFILAAAGLLDGLQATTFPSDISRLRDRFGAQVNVVDGVSFVHDGSAVTSAGGALSFEASLYVVERLYGRKSAQGVARGVCIDWELAAVAHRIAAGASF